MEHLSNYYKDHPNQHENSHKLCTEMGICYELDGKSMKTETTTWSKFSNGEKAIVEEILASEERIISRRAGLWES